MRTLLFIRPPLFAVLSALTLLMLGFGTAAQAQHVERDIPYVAGGDPAQVLDLYLPEKPSDKPLPLLIWIHGGGWQAGSKGGCYFTYLVGQGYAAASIEYRFSQKALFPAQIQDCKAAIRWLRANAKKYNLDPKRFAAGGDSAGGHLSALVGTSGGKKAFPVMGGNESYSDRVQAIVDLYGPTDFNTVMAQAAADPTKNVFNFNHGDPYSMLIGVDLGSDRTKGEAVSPAHYVSKDNPPYLILHGDKDSLVPYAQSLELQSGLQKVGVPVYLQKFAGSGHGGAPFSNAAVHDLVKKFLDIYLGHAKEKLELLPDSAVAP